jgi:uncharacterized membrane protein
LDPDSPHGSALRQLPGWIASALMIGVTVFWTFWGFGEMYHEGWFGAWYNRLPYMAPVALTLIPTLIAFRWPIVGGLVLIGIGLFALGFFDNDVAFIGLSVAAVGGLFVLDGWMKRREPQRAAADERPWWRRHIRYVLAMGLPAVVAVLMSAYNLPIVLARIDDGDRSARLVEGNGVSLVWAPEGPGWNYKQEWGGYPSWSDVALYGVDPVGFDDKPGYLELSPSADEWIFPSDEDMQATNLCRYLTEDGTALADAPVDAWRMPTTDELVRSLVHHGENAGCVWDGEYRTQVECERRPDKESPLWATDHASIYYWTADSYDEKRGYFVAYNGTVNATMKRGGNPRHSYRCVRDP